MQLSQLCSLFFVSSALALAMNGCGGTATLVDPHAVAQAAQQLKVQAPTPVVVAATPAPTPAPLINATLQATLKTFKKGTLGLGKSTATVEITNSSPIALTGTMKISFTDNGTVKGTPQTQEVTLPPRGSQTFTFTSSSWFLDNAQIEIVTANGGIDGGTGARASGVY